MSVQNKPTEEDVRVKLRAMFASQEVLAADSSARKFFMFAFASVLCLYTCSDDIGRPFRDLLDTQGNLTKNDKAVSVLFLECKLVGHWYVAIRLSRTNMYSYSQF